jgi:hypothetical protein
MYTGTVTFRAEITSHGLQFPACEFNPNQSSVEKVVIESQSGFEILSTVHLCGVVTERAGRAIANKVLTAVLDRIAFQYSVAIEDSQIVSSWFAPVNPLPEDQGQPHSGEFAIIVQQADPIVGILAAHLKAELEQTTLSGEPFFNTFRLALKSRSSEEKFMHLYNLLLRFFEDEQAKVDDFIRSQDSAVPQSPDPRPGRTNQETVYTRLRNEFAQRRSDVNMQATKAEIEQRVGGLSGLVKQAIALQDKSQSEGRTQ